MKKIHARPHSGDTMTVKELMDALSEYPSDMAVIATWEGVCAGIRKDNFYVEENTDTLGERLFIDVENYG